LEPAKYVAESETEKNDVNVIIKYDDSLKYKIIEILQER